MQLPANPSFAHFALRDAAILLVAVLLWQTFASLSATPSASGDFFGVVVGAAACLCAHLAHEWGHTLGGMATHSVMRPGAHLKSFSIFVFDSHANNKRQFVLMSLAGFAATAAMVLIAFAVLPVDYLASRILRGYVVLQVVLALVIEVPLLAWALVGRTLPPVDKKAL